jgi:hypothetical protein
MQDSPEQGRASAAGTLTHDDASHDAGHGDNGKETVTITVNNVAVPIHRGHQTVAQIKTAGHVAAADDLEQLVDKRLIPLADNAAVTIKGDEVFVSHPKDSASSHDALFASACIVAEA